MDAIEDLVRNFQELVSQAPEILQPFVVMLAAAVPFIEGEVAALIGVVGGLNPVVTAIAAALGNFICVLFVVLLSSRARTAVIDRKGSRGPAKPESKGQQKFKRWLVRFGVPGASILGPLAIPTQFTSALLVAGGTPQRWVLLWQGVAIVLWTTVSTVSMWAALTFVVGV